MYYISIYILYSILFYYIISSYYILLYCIILYFIILYYIILYYYIHHNTYNLDMNIVWNLHGFKQDYPCELILLMFVTFCCQLLMTA